MIVYEMIRAVLSLDAVLVGLFIGGAWIAYRAQKGAAEDEEAMRQAGCVAGIEELMRRVCGSPADALRFAIFRPETTEPIMKEHGENWATLPAPCPPRAAPHRRGGSRRPRHTAKNALQMGLRRAASGRQNRSADALSGLHHREFDCAG